MAMAERSRQTEPALNKDYLRPEDRILWETVARTTTPLVKKKLITTAKEGPGCIERGCHSST